MHCHGFIFIETSLYGTFVLIVPCVTYIIVWYFYSWQWIFNMFCFCSMYEHSVHKFHLYSSVCLNTSVFVWTLEIYSVLLAFMAVSYGVGVISRGRCLYTLSGWCKLLIEHSTVLLPFTLIFTFRRGHVQARSRVALRGAEIPAAHFCTLCVSKLITSNCQRSHWSQLYLQRLHPIIYLVF